MKRWLKRLWHRLNYGYNLEPAKIEWPMTTHFIGGPRDGERAHVPPCAIVPIYACATNWFQVFAGYFESTIPDPEVHAVALGHYYWLVNPENRVVAYMKWVPRVSG